MLKQAKNIKDSPSVGKNITRKRILRIVGKAYIKCHEQKYSGKNSTGALFRNSAQSSMKSLQGVYSFITFANFDITMQKARFRARRLANNEQW